VTPASNRFEALAQPGMRQLRAYDPGHDLIAFRRRFGASERLPLIELGSNENAFGPSPKAGAAMLRAMADVFRYPDPLGGDLKLAIAEQQALQPAQVLLGNGSHELLMQFGQVFAGPDCNVVMSRYGFAVYALAAQATGAGLRVAPALDRGAAMPLGHDLDALSRAVNAQTRLLYVANPNNPTGTWFPTSGLERMLQQIPPEVVVVVDEAYHEYVDAAELTSAVALLPRFANLVVTRTFSKAYGLAGLRIGYALANPEMIALMERLRESFNVNCMALAAAQAALDDQAHLHWVRKQNAEARSWLTQKLEQRGLRVLPSQTNFLLVEFGDATARIEQALTERGVILRPMQGYGLADFLRITVATRSEMQRLLQALDEIGA
jgi:histidinol-phosphate aminotransferase